MMRYLSAFAVAVSVLMALNAQAGESISVFGLPLGGQLKPQPKICPHNWLKAKSPCWLTGLGRVYKSSDRMGVLHMPNPDALPRWAAYAQFTLVLDKDGELKIVSVATHTIDDEDNIAKSIISRFGSPTATETAQHRFSSRIWNLQRIYIKMLCAYRSSLSDRDYCEVRFSSPRAKAELDRLSAEALKRESTRPASP